MSKQPAATVTVTVYPAVGRFLMGIPHVETTTDAETAAYLVETEAFTYDPPTTPATPVEPEEN